jgi:hypothetical protein
MMRDIPLTYWIITGVMLIVVIAVGIAVGETFGISPFLTGPLFGAIYATYEYRGLRRE